MYRLSDVMYHRDGTAPINGEIFVFGSNLAGIHGAGAARVAHRQFGAIMGLGSGIMGNSYAIPTKDLVIESLSLSEIIPHINTFAQYTLDNPDKNFFVTRVGCGLAGNLDKDVAPLFKGCGNNCSFPIQQWEEYIG